MGEIRTIKSKAQKNLNLRRTPHIPVHFERIKAIPLI